MILSDTRILEEIEKGTIKIKPYRREDLGSNSYDCHLGEWLGLYLNGLSIPVWDIITGQKQYNRKIMKNYVKEVNEKPLDAAMNNSIVLFKIPPKGLVLYNSVFYLGATEEYTETHAHVPFIEGKSSTGRLSIDIHATAGKGDVGFCGFWTLEISVKQSVKVYAGMPIGQLIYFPVDGEVEVNYNNKKNAKYSVQGNMPKESMMWKNKFFDQFNISHDQENAEKFLSKAEKGVLERVRLDHGVYS